MEDIDICSDLSGIIIENKNTTNIKIEIHNGKWQFTNIFTELKAKP